MLSHFILCESEAIFLVGVAVEYAGCWYVRLAGNGQRLSNEFPCSYYLTLYVYVFAIKMMMPTHIQTHTHTSAPANNASPILACSF